MVSSVCALLSAIFWVTPAFLVKLRPLPLILLAVGLVALCKIVETIYLRRSSRATYANGAPKPGVSSAGSLLLLALIYLGVGKGSGTATSAIVAADPSISGLTAIILCAITALLFFAATRTWELPATCAGIQSAAMYPLLYGVGWDTGIVIGLSGYLVVEAVASICSRSLLKIGGAEVKMWRIVARPFALLFILFDVLFSRRVLLLVIGTVALIFIVTDFIRLGTKAELSVLFKLKEKNRFSSMTLFLVAAFLTFLLFPAGIPYVSLICITLGDFFSKLIGIRFGTKKLVKKKTVQGSIAFFAGSLMFCSLAVVLLDVPLLYALVGSAIATIVELLSETIDDNFSVSIVTGGVLAALRYFLSV